MRKNIMVFLILMLLVISGVSAASAKGFKVQLMEEGKEYTQFTGDWPWDIQPFTLPYQRADDHCFINPNGGRYAHLDQYCRSVHQKYLPLTKVEYTDEIAQKYEFCPVCCINP